MNRDGANAAGSFRRMATPNPGPDQQLGLFCSTQATTISLLCRNFGDHGHRYRSMLCRVRQLLLGGPRPQLALASAVRRHSSDVLYRELAFGEEFDRRRRANSMAHAGFVKNPMGRSRTGGKRVHDWDQKCVDARIGWRGVCDRWINRGLFPWQPRSRYQGMRCQNTKARSARAELHAATRREHRTAP